MYRPNIDHQVKQLLVLCYFVVMGMSLLIFIATKTGASEPLPGKMTSISAAIPAYRQCLPSHCLANGHISSQHNIIFSVV